MAIIVYPMNFLMSLPPVIKSLNDIIRVFRVVVDCVCRVLASCLVTGNALVDDVIAGCCLAVSLAVDASALDAFNQYVLVVPVNDPALSQLARINDPDFEPFSRVYLAAFPVVVECGHKTLAGSCCLVGAPAVSRYTYC